MSQKNFVSFGDAETLMTELVTVIDNKVDKVNGKGLSTNDYTNADKSIVDGVTSALAGKVDTSSVGYANGVAELDANGRVPSSQLPSYVDDVLEYADLAHFPATGETGKIYIAEDTNKTYRWSGSDYAEISESLALGETSSTAYAGNKGKANADAISNLNALLTKTLTVVNINSTYDANTDWNIVKQGNICVMNMRNLKDIPTGWTTIGNIPVGYRPESSFYEYIYSANKNTHLGFAIYDGGEVAVNNQTDSTLSGNIYVNRNITYFTA